MKSFLIIFFCIFPALVFAQLPNPQIVCRFSIPSKKNASFSLVFMAKHTANLYLSKRVCEIEVLEWAQHKRTNSIQIHIKPHQCLSSTWIGVPLLKDGSIILEYTGSAWMGRLNFFSGPGDIRCQELALAKGLPERWLHK